MATGEFISISPWVLRRAMCWAFLMGCCQQGLAPVGGGKRLIRTRLNKPRNKTGSSDAVGAALSGSPR